MSDRSKLISRLLSDRDFRASYIRAKLDVLIPSQLRALRLRQEKSQPELAQMADMKQSRISAMETPGLVNFNRETLVRMAATHNVGLVIKFVPFSEMLEWENSYSQDAFNIARLSEDIDFLQPRPVRTVSTRFRHRRRAAPRSKWLPQRMGKVGAGTNVIAMPQQGPQLRLPFEQPASQQVDFQVISQSSNPVGATLNLPVGEATGGTERLYGT